jgi:hypothetical protein
MSEDLARKTFRKLDPHVSRLLLWLVWLADRALRVLDKARDRWGDEEDG